MMLNDKWPHGDPDILEISRVTYIDLIENPVLSNELIPDYNPIVLNIGPEAANYEAYTVRKTDRYNIPKHLEKIPPPARPITGQEELLEAVVDILQWKITETIESAG